MYTYDRATVRALLPVVLDDLHGIYKDSTSAPYRHVDPATLGIATRRRPSSANDASEVWAMRADVARAWRRSPRITAVQRRALDLVAVLDLRYTEAGELLGLAPNTVQQQAEAGLDHLAAYLNGNDLRHAG